MQPEPIITVKEARKILGKKSETMSDDQVETLIDSLQVIAETSLSNQGS